MLRHTVRIAPALFLSIKRMDSRAIAGIPGDRPVTGSNSGLTGTCQDNPASFSPGIREASIASLMTLGFGTDNHQE